MAQGPAPKTAGRAGPGCSRPSTSVAGCFGVESYQRREGPTAARTDAGNAAAPGNGDGRLRALAMCMQQLMAPEISSSLQTTSSAVVASL